jgi:hypothetical protein
MSRHFKPNNSLCLNPVDAASRTGVFSLSASPCFDFVGQAEGQRDVRLSRSAVAQE